MTRFHQTFDFGTKYKGPVLPVIEKGPDSDPVPSQEQFFLPGIPYCKGKLSIQLLQALLTKMLVQEQQYLGITSCPEAITQRDQLLPEFNVVKDFSIEDDPELPSFVTHGLLTMGQVYNTQPDTSQANTLTNINTRLIRPTILDLLEHVPD